MSEVQQGAVFGKRGVAWRIKHKEKEENKRGSGSNGLKS